MLNFQKQPRYIYHLYHCGLNVSRSQAKIDENFAIYFFKPKGNTNNKCFIVLNVHVNGNRKV